MPCTPNGQEAYFFTEFGLNSAAVVYPNELFPVGTRTTGNGITAANGKIRRVCQRVPVVGLPCLGRLHLAKGFAALVSVLGMAVTTFMLPETKGRGLEELSAI